jgi:hypothetical protein
MAISPVITVILVPVDRLHFANFDALLIGDDYDYDSPSGKVPETDVAVDYAVHSGSSPKLPRVGAGLSSESDHESEIKCEPEKGVKLPPIFAPKSPTTEFDSTNIKVALRCRPLSLREQGSRFCLRCSGNTVFVLSKIPDDKDYLRKDRAQEKRFTFDHVFDQNCNQEQVYHSTTRGLISQVLNGFNATVFAYGATGAGKTFTMLGTEENPGIMALTLQDMFRVITENEATCTYTITLSYIEIYNELIRDLLNPTSGQLTLREDPLKGMIVHGAQEVVATSATEVLDMLRTGNAQRTTEATGANLVSSRSHAVLQLVIESRDRLPGTKSVRCSKLSLIDLAGSERANKTKNKGLQLVESSNINRSLLALANCITALSGKTPSQHVPYRDSKLTLLLKDSLGGNCRTIMIANVSPSDLSLEETLVTLKWADRAKEIKNNVYQNEIAIVHNVAEYKRIIKDLKGQVRELKHRLGDNVYSSPLLPELPVQARQRKSNRALSKPDLLAIAAHDSPNKPEGAPNPGGHNGGRGNLRFVRAQEKLRLVLESHIKLFEETLTLEELRNGALESLRQQREALQKLNPKSAEAAAVLATIRQEEEQLEESSRVKALLHEQLNMRAFVVKKTVRQLQKNPRLSPAMKFALDVEHQAHEVKRKLMIFLSTLIVCR